jgi:hypothetical protein
MDSKNLIGTKEAKEILGVTDARVRQLLAAGQIPGAFQLGGERGNWVMNRAVVEQITLPGQGWPKGKKRKPTRKKAS